MNWRGLGDMKLYRRKWAETDNALVNEARAQTLAIQRLQVWLRLAYAILAIAVLIGYWGFTTSNALAAGIFGIVLGVCAFLAVAVLRMGISNGRKNVNAMLEELQSQGIH
jgi:hypothetical protein